MILRVSLLIICMHKFLPSYSYYINPTKHNSSTKFYNEIFFGGFDKTLPKPNEYISSVSYNSIEKLGNKDSSTDGVKVNTTSSNDNLNILLSTNETQFTAAIPVDENSSADTDQASDNRTSGIKDGVNQKKAKTIPELDISKGDTYPLQQLDLTDNPMTNGTPELRVGVFYEKIIFGEYINESSRNPEGDARFKNNSTITETSPVPARVYKDYSRELEWIEEPNDIDNVIFDTVSDVKNTTRVKIKDVPYLIDIDQKDKYYLFKPNKKKFILKGKIDKYKKYYETLKYKSSSLLSIGPQISTFTTEEFAEHNGHKTTPEEEIKVTETLLTSKVPGIVERALTDPTLNRRRGELRSVDGPPEKRPNNNTFEKRRFNCTSNIVGHVARCNSSDLLVEGNLQTTVFDELQTPLTTAVTGYLLIPVIRLKAAAPVTVIESKAVVPVGSGDPQTPITESKLQKYIPEDILRRYLIADRSHNRGELPATEDGLPKYLIENTLQSPADVGDLELSATQGDIQEPVTVCETDNPSTPGSIVFPIKGRSINVEQNSKYIKIMFQDFDSPDAPLDIEDLPMLIQILINTPEPEGQAL